MIILNASTNDFTIHDKHFIADISDFQTNFPDIINLKSERTGKISEWIKIVTKTNKNDILYVEYVPTGKTSSKFSSLKGWAITIYND